MKNKLQTLKSVLLFWLFLGIPTLLCSLTITFFFLICKFQCQEPLWYLALKLTICCFSLCLFLALITWLVLLVTKRQIPEVFLYIVGQGQKSKTEHQSKTEQGGDK